MKTQTSREIPKHSEPGWNFEILILKRKNIFHAAEVREPVGTRRPHI